MNICETVVRYISFFVIASGLQLLNTILIEKGMGLEAVGQYGVFLSTIMMLAVVFQFGLRDFATIHYANNSSGSKNITALLRTAVLLCIIMGLVLTAVHTMSLGTFGAYQFLLENPLSISLSVLLLVFSGFLSGVAIANRDFIALGFFRDYGRHLATFVLIMLLFLLPDFKDYFYLGWTVIFFWLCLIFSYSYLPVLKETAKSTGRFFLAFKKSTSYYLNDLLLNVAALGDVLLLAFFWMPKSWGYILFVPV